MDKIKLGIIGAGRLGGFHAEKGAAHQNMVLTGICDSCQKNGKRLADKMSVPFYDDLDTLLSRVDAVVIAAPSRNHYELGKQCLENNRHVLMEKPMTTESAHAVELGELARARGLVLNVGHVEQYNPVWQAIEPYLQGIRSGQVPCFLNARRTSFFPFRCLDVGVALDLMIHDLGLALDLLAHCGDIVEQRGHGLVQMGGYEDIAMASLSFANGSTAHFYASRADIVPSRCLQIVSTNEKLDLDFQTRSYRRITADKMIQRFNPEPDNQSGVSIFDEWPNGFPSPADFAKEHHQIEEKICDPQDALALEMDDFCRSILLKTPCRVSLEVAVKAVTIACSLFSK